MEAAEEEESREESSVDRSADSNSPDLPGMIDHAQDKGCKGPFEKNLPCYIQLEPGHQVLTLCQPTLRSEDRQEEMLTCMALSSINPCW